MNEMMLRSFKKSIIQIKNHIRAIKLQNKKFTSLNEHLTSAELSLLQSIYEIDKQIEKYQ